MILKSCSFITNHNSNITRRKSPLRFCSLAAIFCLSIVLLATPSLSHPEKDSQHGAVAEMEYLILLDMQPDNVEARYKLAMIYYRMHKLKKAQNQLTEALRRTPDHFHALVGMGQVLARSKQFPQAIDYYKKAIAVQPEDANVHYLLGLVLEQSGKYNNAEKEYLTAISYLNSPEDDHNHHAEDLEKLETALQRVQDHLVSNAPNTAR